ncbi:hypothetical protein LUZ63_015779 [Rhynchospora breviuscula]|uniref:Adenylosuccinate lyase n=1 Tax=Rhynchospora breviuscula TaxID=2022672 RepID=A0A9Q0CDP3_9POAL|nr:hypothetical protein LUZ63_015779 [Rhynchospora breviuscula]
MPSTCVLLRAAASVRRRVANVHHYSGQPKFQRRVPFDAALTLASTVPAIGLTCCYNKKERGLMCNSGSHMDPTDDEHMEISDLDSRDARMANELLNLTNEYALVFYQVLVEVRWLLKLSEIPEVKDVPTFSQDARTFLENIIQEFNVNEALKVKKIEQVTNHDVKAVVYYLKQKCKSQSEVSKVLEFFHFACTSADINNLAYGLLVKNVMNDVMFPVMTDLCKAFCALAKENAHIPMLSHFHGQRPSPTTLGKEMATFAFRLGFRAQRMSERDLTHVIFESTELGFAHSLVGYKKILQGIKNLKVNESRIAEGLEKNWVFLAMAINIVMERYDVPKSYYEKLMELTRGGVVDRESITSFIKNLDLPEKEKLNLLNLTPQSYIEEAEDLARSIDEALGPLSGFKIK